MAKQCTDCGTENGGTAVTCSECGALFEDMVGRLQDPSTDFRAGAGSAERLARRVGDPIAGESERTAALAQHPAVECTKCGSVFFVGPDRCARCGSRKFRARAESGITEGGFPVGAGSHGRAPNGSELRPDTDTLEHSSPDIPYQVALVFVAFGVLKVFVEIPLGISLLVAGQGKGGLNPATLSWQYPLGFGLLTAALLAGLGAYSLYYLQNLGAAFLSAAFAFDVLLLIWLLGFMHTEGNSVWPGSGPYGVLALACGISSVYLGLLAVRKRLL